MLEETWYQDFWKPTASSFRGILLGFLRGRLWGRLRRSAALGAKERANVRHSRLFSGVSCAAILMMLRCHRKRTNLELCRPNGQQCTHGSLIPDAEGAFRLGTRFHDAKFNRIESVSHVGHCQASLRSAERRLAFSQQGTQYPCLVRYVKSGPQPDSVLWYLVQSRSWAIQLTSS